MNNSAPGGLTGSEQTTTGGSGGSGGGNYNPSVHQGNDGAVGSQFWMSVIVESIEGLVTPFNEPRPNKDCLKEGDVFQIYTKKFKPQVRVEQGDNEKGPWETMPGEDVNGWSPTDSCGLKKHLANTMFRYSGGLHAQLQCLHSMRITVIDSSDKPTRAQRVLTCSELGPNLDQVDFSRLLLKLTDWDPIKDPEEFPPIYDTNQMMMPPPDVTSPENNNANTLAPRSH